MIHDMNMHVQLLTTLAYSYIARDYLEILG